ncbi:MAG: glycosyltransferase family 1 protein [Bacteroides sp.]|nr:glycosyltransferase family 1 protein [Bacteroides sp.]
MKAVVYPNLLRKDAFSNTYIDDFISALESCGIEVENKPHKNPLIGLWNLPQESKYYFFHWVENVPDYKYGYLQALFACLYVGYLRIKKKKVIWFLHNKSTHTGYRTFVNGLLMRFMARYASIVISHSSEGLAYIETLKKGSSRKTRFLDYPSKNRLPEKVCEADAYTCDLLIWGTIAPHKRVQEFLEFHHKHQLKLKVKVIGKCIYPELQEAIIPYQNEYIDFNGTSIPFEELAKEIAGSRFVLIPYASESLLSSGTLMDSLSFGARVIGPDVGSFRDYAGSQEIEVYTFRDFTDIPDIVKRHTGTPRRITDYPGFLNRTSWPHVMKQIIEEIENS